MRSGQVAFRGGPVLPGWRGVRKLERQGLENNVIINVLDWAPAQREGERERRKKKSVRRWKRLS